MDRNNNSDSMVLVTICIPSFNRAHLIGETLESLLLQTLPQWEAIVVDDGSTDNSKQIISKYASIDSRIRLVDRNRGPKGACTCRNIAVNQGRGRYVLFLDTDDLLAPGCLAQRVGVMESNPTLDFAVFPMLLFRDEAKKADRLWNVDSPEDDLVRLLKLDPICQGTGTLWKRESFIEVGEWNESLHVWQDIELHLRAFTANLIYLKRMDLPPDTYLRETDSSLSRGGYQSREKLESRSVVMKQAVRLLRQAGKSNLVPMVRYFCSSVVLGAAASNNLDIARDAREWGVREGVLSPAEARRLRFAEIARLSKLDRTRFVRQIRDRLADVFRAPTTIGRTRVQPV